MQTLADMSLIGGKPMDRLAAAFVLRLQGVSVFTELTNRKRQRMHQRAVKETWRGEAGVADVTDELEFSVVASRALDFVS